MSDITKLLKQAKEYIDDTDCPALFGLCTHLGITLADYYKLRVKKPKDTAMIETWLAAALYTAMLDKKISDRVFMLMLDGLGIQSKEESGNVVVQLSMPEKVRYD